MVEFLSTIVAALGIGLLVFLTMFVVLMFVCGRNEWGEW
jgi:uncharacterized membrane protein